MTQELILWILGGALTVIGSMVIAIWKMTRAETKDHSEQLRHKVDIDRVHEIEVRLQGELGKLEARHDREMDQMAQRLGEQIRNSETNILTQIRLMIQVIQNKE